MSGREQQDQSASGVEGTGVMARITWRQAAQATRQRLQLNQNKVPHLDFFRRKRGMSCSPGPLVAHLPEYSGGVVQLKSESQLFPRGVSPGTGTDSSAVDSFLSNVFFSAAPFFLFQFASSRLQPGSDIASSFGFKMQARPFSRPFSIRTGFSLGKGP
ncbi:hypothetical protein GWK47_010943 [Chionoecetes opilio]|uniref:Uncharacterized protein n=1 Tax=Chionoecetes opilio TaxID=41210 RepID=A0A8J4Y422_CHIOP|nr:hypothetical protein GWK47_010943 [Chionoecetes opilio]